MKDLKSGIEHIKQAKAHMLQATWIMSDCISKLKTLEEENERLKDELSALQIQPDASCMKLPLDADGVPIRIGDEMDIDGEIAVVKGYQVSYKGDELQFIAVTEGYRKTFTLFGKNRKHFKHGAMPADSWAKLEEDARKTSCDYASAPLDKNGFNTCDGCRFQNGGPCHIEKTIDLVERAKKLAGIEEEAQR